MTTKTLITADELLLLPSEQRCELINGELVEMSPSGYWHANIHFLIGARLQNYLENNPIGCGFGGEGGFLISRNPDTVRAPHLAFVRNARLPKRFGKGYFPGPPDLAVEVISPNDHSSEVSEKVSQWLQAGSVCVWTIDPVAKIAMIHQLENGFVVARQTLELHCEELLPGLRIPVADVLR